MIETATTKHWAGRGNALFDDEPQRPGAVGGGLAASGREGPRSTGEGPRHRRVRIPVRAPEGVPEAAWGAWLRATAALTKIDSPGVQPLFSLRRDGEILEIMAGPADGKEIRQAVLEDAPSAEQAITWLLHVAEALAQVHGAGGVHGRLDGRHVTVDARGGVQLTGLALTDPGLDLAARPDLLPFELRLPPTERSDLEGFVGLAAELGGFLPELEPLVDSLENAVDGPQAETGLDVFDLHAIVSRYWQSSATQGAGDGLGAGIEIEEPEGAPPVATPDRGSRAPISRRRVWRLAVPALAVVLAAVLWAAMASRKAGVVDRPAATAGASPAILPGVRPAADSSSASLPARMERARKALESGDRTEAGRLLEGILADPGLRDPVPALQALGLLRLKEGRNREAAGLLERALGLQPSAHLYYLTALAQAASGAGGEARKRIREGLRRYPGDEALLDLGARMGAQP